MVMTRRTSEQKCRKGLHFMSEENRYPDGRCAPCARDLDRQRDWHMRKYGISLSEYNSMVESRHGKCDICGQVPNRLSVDHDHDTGKVRGLLCQPCNLALGHFMDDPNALRSAANYLENR